MTSRRGKQQGGTAYVADVHIANHAAGGMGHLASHGLNARGHLCVETFGRAMQMAAERGCSRFVVAGDLFHSWRPEPPLLAAVQREIDRWGLRVVLVPGNHDMRDAVPSARSTALETLAEAGVTVIRGPCWEGDLLCVPFQAEHPMDDHLEAVLADVTAGPRGRRQLVCHVGVVDNDSPHWAKGARDSVHIGQLMQLMSRAQIDLTVVGNYHTGRRWTVQIHGDSYETVQVGALCPWSFGDAGRFPERGGMLVVKPGEKPELVEVPGPRFIELGPGEELPDDGSTYHVRLRGTPGVVVAGGGLARAAYVELAPEEEPDPESADRPQADDPEEALAEYARTRGMTPDELAEALRFWKEAG